ncbi:MAG: hypothetical protein OXJ64_14595, partial [Boseongicola sp.]|nr:hypothetical protein [Boseongicola sp.]
MRHATLIEIGLLAPDLGRPAELDMLCDALEDNLPVDGETTLSVILQSGADADNETPPDAEAVREWTQGVIVRLSENGDRIAVRLAAARAVAEAVGAFGLVQPLNDRAETCHGAGKTGLWPALKVTDLRTELAAEVGEPWAVTLQGTAVLALCGPTGKTAAPGGGEFDGGLERSIDLARVSVPFKLPPMALDAVPDVEEIKRAVLTAARERVRNVRIDSTDLNALSAADVRRLAETAGLPIPAIEILGGNPLVPEHVAGFGLVLRVNFGSSEVAVFGETVQLEDVELCLAVPLVPDPDGLPAGCVTADNFSDAVAGALARSVAQPVLASLMASFGLTAEEATALHGMTVSMAHDQGKWALQVTVPEEALRLHAGEDGKLITGDLVLRVALPAGSGEGSAKASIVELPALDATAILRRIAKLTSNKFVALREIAGLPEDLGRADPTCTPEPGSRQPRLYFQADLLAAAPVSGRLAYVCVDTVTPKFSIVLAKDTELISANGQWRFRIERRRLEESDGNGGKLTLAVTVTTSKQGFEIIGTDGAAAVVALDLGQGTWRLPADADKNRDIYGAIETSMNRILPEGVRIHGVEISSEGIKVNLDSTEAAWTLVSESGIDANIDLDAIAAKSCRLLKLSDLARMIGTGTPVRVSAAVVACGESYDPLSTEVEFAAGAIDWECDLDREDESRLSECEVGFARDVTFCDVSSLDVAVTWRDGNPKIQSRDLRNCVERSLEALLPDIDGIKVDLDDIALMGRCADDPRSCGFSVTAGIDLADLLGEASTLATVRETIGEDCTIDDEARIAVTGRLYLSGAGGVDMAAGDTDALRNRLARCGAAVARWVAARAIESAGGEGVSAEDALRPLAEAGGRALGATRRVIESATGLETKCTLTLETADRPACATLSAEHVLRDGLRGAVFRTRADLFGSRLDIVARYELDLSRLAPELLVAEGFDARAYWRAATAAAKAVFEIACADGDGAAGAACLDPAAKKLVEAVPGDILAYPGGARIKRDNSVIRVILPLEFKSELLPTDLRIEADCRLQLPEQDSGLEALDFACSADAAEIALNALADALAETLEEDKEFGLDLGLVAVSLSNPRYVNGEIAIDAKAELAGLEGVLPEKLDEASGIVRIDRSFGIDVQIDWRTFVSALTDHLTDAVNELAGKVLPVRIASITAEFADEGPPEAVLIESEADIGGLFAISAPALRLSETGLGVDGPNRFSVKFEEGLQIPVPPVAICPNGGAIEDTTLTIRANVTIGECTASHVLRFAGSVTMDLAYPLRLESEGDLVLLSVLPLGHTEGEIDLGVPLLRQTGELGGSASDIIRMAGQFEANLHADTMAVTADGEIDVFKVRVGDADFLLDLRKGILDTGYLADIGFARGFGRVGTKAGFSQPRADLETEMSVSGFPLLGGEISARPRHARVGISIFGAGLALTVPGLDMLNPGRVADLLAGLLKINFKDLGKALAALFSGDVTLSPFSGFGSGGDGMGDSSDSGKGASGGDAPDDPGEGLGDEAPEGEADGNGEPVEAPGAEGGFAGTGPVELWFERAGEFISIGSGARGSPKEARIALAVPDADHFDETISQVGQTMAVLDRGYSQVLPLSKAYAGAPCDTGGDFAHMVALYTKVAERPRRGYYELCRIREAEGRPLTPEVMRGLDIDERRDLAVFQDALLAELGARETLPGHGHGRILLRARMMAGDDLRGVIGFQRVGEALVSMRGSLKGECGTEAKHDPSVMEASRIFWITGLAAEEIDDADVILPVVRSIWGCTPGTLARVDQERSTLVTATTMSRAGNEGFKAIAMLPEDTEADVPQGAPPPWVAEVEAAAEARANAASRTAEAEEAAVDLAVRIVDAQSMGQTIRRPFCESDCNTLSVTFAAGGNNGCILSIGGNETSDFNPNGLTAFGADCRPQDPFLWIDVGSLGTAAAIVASEKETRTIRVGAFLGDSLALTPPLALGFDRNTITPPDAKLIEGLADRFEGKLRHVESILSDGAEAALRVVLDGRSEWRVRRPGKPMDFALFGDEPLGPDQARALLPALGPGIDSVNRLDDDDLSVRAGAELRILRWTNGAWIELATMRDTALSEAVIEHLVAQDGLPPRLRVTIVSYVREVGGWAYAWTDPESGDGSLVVRPVEELDFGGTVPVPRGFSGPEPIDATEPFAWIELDLPKPVPDFAIEVTGEGTQHKV